MNQKFRLTKKQERAIIIALLGVLVAYGFYQTAHGMAMGPSGTMNVPGMPNRTWTTITAPPGSTVSNVTITPLPHMVDLTGTWHFGAAGTVTFHITYTTISGVGQPVFP